MSAATPSDHQYVVYLAHDSTSRPRLISVPKNASVLDLEFATRRDPDYQDYLGYKPVFLYKCGGLERKPLESLYGRALDWLREHAGEVGEITPLDPADRLNEYFPEGPTPEHEKMVDVIAMDGSTVAPAKRRKRSRPSSEESSKAGDSILRKLGENETAIWHRLAFNLHNYLWGQRDRLKEICEPKEKDVPKVGWVSATFWNLRNLPFWPTGVTSLDLAEHFMIRDEYRELDTYITEKLENPFFLKLTLQLGKTVYLTYCLLGCLFEKEPTILMLRPNIRYLFQDDGVYSLPGESYVSTDDSAIIQEPLGRVLVLYDCNSDQEKAILACPGTRMLISTSPKKSRYHRFEKEQRAEMFVMQTWAWYEIYLCCDMAKQQRSSKELAIAYCKYGGSARNLLNEGEDKLERLLRDAIDSCDKLDIMITQQKTVSTMESSQLVQINPSFKDNVLNRSSMTASVISVAVLCMLCDAKDREFLHHLESRFQNFTDCSEIFKASAGIAFEAASHRYIMANTRTPFDIRSLSNQHITKQLHLSHVTDLCLFSPHDPKASLLQSNQYYKPLAKNLPGIDAYAFEMDGGTICGIVFFQFTITTHHPINQNFLDNLWTSWPGYCQHWEWKLIFVVPEGIAPGYKEQQWQPNYNEDIWKRRVSQYVLGVNQQQLWEAMQMQNVT
ncbi:uncharacterized protein FOMMEDRAFT_163396 [Fomitiporia mediterranea MF3/22]|uniref:Uncharacterized protein n=1 Tax=Fomitiporia mediterranea (strain MF3/22) TaxID=694068 RepID=R7SIK0_FOMME|nr:uncharacterized protein FOMMEDRAFT_163396 [Fomitiporia mediterranea MF3/22]EJC97434.1 hypothetical protein FOMMEDRAFT_163396 [Fomitiporia mediterranea MF3/22]